jgi:hypothetical protein
MHRPAGTKLLALVHVLNTHSLTGMHMRTHMHEGVTFNIPLAKIRYWPPSCPHAHPHKRSQTVIHNSCTTSTHYHRTPSPLIHFHPFTQTLAHKVLFYFFLPLALAHVLNTHSMTVMHMRTHMHEGVILSKNSVLFPFHPFTQTHRT